MIGRRDMAGLALALALAGVGLGADEAQDSEAPVSPPGLRLVALEPGSNPPRAWLQLVEDGSVRSLAVGESFGEDRLVELKPAEGSIVFEMWNPSVPPEERARLLKPRLAVTWSTFGTLPDELFGAAAGSCPRYLDRVEGGEAVVQAKDGEELRLANGAELCGGWRVAELTAPSEPAPEGLLVLGKGARRLIVRPAWP